MAKSKRKKTDKLNPGSPRVTNRRAHHDYQILEKIETGLVLQGTEVKAIRLGQISLAEGYARIEPRTMELWLHDVHIGIYPPAGPQNHNPTRPRKILAHKKQIERLVGLTTGKGVTLVPLTVFFNGRGIIKMDLGVAQGKRRADKRQDMKERDAKRQIERGMTRKVL